MWQDQLPSSACSEEEEKNFSRSFIYKIDIVYLPYDTRTSNKTPLQIQS